MNAAEVKRVGFVGLGNIGKPMAINLVKRGFNLTVFDIRPEPLKELGMLGAKVAASTRELAQVSDFIITMVLDNAQTEQVVYGKEGLWDGLNVGTTLIVMSTIDPQFVRDLSQKAKERGVAVLDAAVSGGAMGAEKGTLNIMVGGDEKVFEGCRPLFKAMGKNTFHIGGIGSGLVVKLVNNMMYAINIFGVLEGLRLGVKAGISRESLIQVVKISSGKSGAIEDWDHVERRIAEYEESRGTGRFPWVYKDLGLALDLAKALDLELPILALISQLDLSD